VRTPVSSEKLDVLELSLLEAGQVLAQHRMNLNLEAQRRVTAARNHSELVQANAIEIEMNALSHVLWLGETLEASIGKAGAVASVRDAMIDRRDTDRANRVHSARRGVRCVQNSRRRGSGCQRVRTLRDTQNNTLVASKGT
jgi:hypothetical protein